MSSSVLIPICGMIACGKTTLAEYLGNHTKGTNLSSKLYKEPIPERLLQLFLMNLTSKERSTLSFAVQHTYSASRLRDLVLGYHSKVDLVIQDQGPWFDLAFLEALKESLTEDEYNTYKTLINQRIKHVESMYSRIVVVYLDQDLETCIFNMNKRKRNGETEYKLPYLKNLHTQMKKVYTDLKKRIDSVEENDILKQKYKFLTFTFDKPSKNAGENRKLLSVTCNTILKECKNAKS